MVAVWLMKAVISNILNSYIFKTLMYEFYRRGTSTLPDPDPELMSYILLNKF